MIPGRRFLRPARLALVTIATVFGIAAPAAQASSPDLVVSQVYGGGGNSGSVYKNDFIEIHNRGGSAVSVTGWSVQYAPATSSSWSVTTLSGSIPAGGYYLVQEAQGAGGTTDLPTPDATGTIPMSATAGKVALVNGTTALAGTCPGDASIVDLVGYGSANCFETAAAPGLSNATAALRARSGCADSDNNSADFAAGTADPRNGASSAFSCQYTLDVGVVGIGTVGKSPDQVAYLDGASVLLTATPGLGQHFVGWSGDASGAANPLAVVMLGSRSIIATFEPDQHTLTVSTVGSGSVARSPDQATYDFDSIVQLTATPATGWHFVGWSGDASGNTNPLDVTMNADKSITATFEIDQHTLGVVTVGSGSVSRSPDQATYDFGSIVQLTAAPATGWHFVGWSGDASGNTNPLDVTMNADKSITATFAENTVVVSQVYGGGGNTGATLTNDFIELFNRGTDAVDLSGWTVQYASAAGTTWLATPLTGSIQPGGYYLVQEAAGAGGSVPLPTPDATGSIAMGSASGKVALVAATAALSGGCPTGPVIQDFVGYGAADCSETSAAPGLSNTTAALRDAGGCEDTDDNAANFSEGAPAPRNSASPANDCQFTLTLGVDPTGAGSVSKSPDQPTYMAGSLVQITATFVGGYHFDHWSGGATGSTNPITVPVNGDLSITAHFVSNAFSGGDVVISQVYGGGGNDYFAMDDNSAITTLDGGSGADAMVGGGGNDIYVVDYTGDSIFEEGGGGVDTVAAIINYFALSDNVENLVFIGNGQFEGVGNDLNNVITGGSLSDLLSGGGGDDHLSGGAGDDHLDGGDGDDHLDGGEGSNWLDGGAGNDWLIIFSGKDTIVLQPGFGNDVVEGFGGHGKDGFDLIDVTAYHFQDFMLGTDILVLSLGDDTVLTIGTDTLTLLNTKTGDVSSSDFIYH